MPPNNKGGLALFYNLIVFDLVFLNDFFFVVFDRFPPGKNCVVVLLEMSVPPVRGVVVIVLLGPIAINSHLE